MAGGGGVGGGGAGTSNWSGDRMSRPPTVSLLKFEYFLLLLLLLDDSLLLPLFASLSACLTLGSFRRTGSTKVTPRSNQRAAGQRMV